MGKALEVGDEGIWVTYARGMKNKAVREFTAMCHEVKLHNPMPTHGETILDVYWLRRG
jgi:tRNA acetyltransferase TAN1